jgi:hypothetical protein
MPLESWRIGIIIIIIVIIIIMIIVIITSTTIGPLGMGLPERDRRGNASKTCGSMPKPQTLNPRAKTKTCRGMP